MVMIQDGPQNTGADKPLRISGEPFKVQVGSLNTYVIRFIQCPYMEIKCHVLCLSEISPLISCASLVALWIGDMFFFLLFSKLKRW